MFEYDRQRAAQALGDRLWQAWMQDYYGENNKPFDVFLNSSFYKNAIPSPNQQRDMVNRVMTEIESVDPTPNKKYTQWMARQFATRNVKRLEDVTSTLASAVTKFHLLNLKKKLPPGENDINRYRTPDQLYQTMDKYEDPEDTPDEKGKARKVYEDSQVTVIVPDDQAAACRYGRNTRWCTAATRGQNLFSHYHQKGPLYIVIPKNPTHENEKYQLHFATNQYMDEEDDPINIGQFLKEKYPSLGKWLLSQSEIEERLKILIEFAPDNVLEKLSEEIYQLVWEHYLMERLSNAEAGDDGYYRWLEEEGYVSEEGEVDWDRAPPYLEYNDELSSEFEKVESALQLDAESIRQIAEDYLEAGAFHADITNLEDVLAWHVAQKLGRDWNELQYWIERNIMIQGGDPESLRAVLVKRG